MWVRALAILFLTISAEASLEDDSCTIDGKIPEEEITLDIKDNSTGIIHVYSTTYTDIQMDKSKYVVGNFSSSTFTVSLTSDFAHYEENESGSHFSPKLTLKCGTHESHTLLTIQIYDYNTYSPKFTKEQYTVVLPMPLPANLHLDRFLEFEATDWDITNNKLIFAIEGSDDFGFAASVPVDALKKTHRSHLVTKRGVDLHTNKTYTISVTDTGTPPRTNYTTLTVIVDEANSVVPPPTFSEPIYRARIEENDTSHIPEIFLDDPKHKPTLTISGEYHDHFSASLKGGRIVVEYKGGLTDEQKEKAYTYLILEASIEEAERPGKTVILIDLPGKGASTTTTLSPSTTTSRTTVTTPPTTTSCPPCTTNCPPCTTSMWTTASTVSPSTACPTPEPCPTTPPTTDKTTSQTTSCPPCTTSIWTSPSTLGPTTACPTPEPCPTTPPTTDKTTSQTSCPPCTTSIWTSPSTLGPTTACPTPQPCPTSEPCPTTPQTTDPTGSTTPLTANPTNNTTPLPTHPTGSTTPPTTHPGSTKTTPTAPQTSTACPPCPTTTWTTSSLIPTTACPFNCSQCPSTTEYPHPSTTPLQPTGGSSTPGPSPTTTTSPPQNVHYDQPLKKFDRHSDFVGVLGVIKAQVTTPEGISYELLADDSVKAMVSYTADGQLEVTSALTVGIYRFSLRAKGQRTGDQDTCKVELKVDNVIVNNGTCEFTQSLLVTNVLENSINYDLVMPNDDCELVIIYQFPEESNWFRVNENGNIQVGPMDREFEKLPHQQPQAKVIVETRNRSEEHYSVVMNRNKRSPDQWVLTESIDNAPSRLVVSVIIDDVNDNNPVFDTETKNVVLGYPDEKLAKFMAPPYLLKVKATDKDAGNNGLITYSTDTQKFLVHPTEGVVSPGKGAFEEDKAEEFKVIASDHGEEPRNDTISVKVMLLDEDKISVITAQGMDFVNIDSYMRDLRTKTSINIRHLTAVALPTHEEKTKLVRNVEMVGTTMKIFIYALDDKDEPMDSNNVIKVIADKESDLHPEDWKTAMSCDSDASITPWIISVSILSVLVITLIVLVIVWYYKYVRSNTDVFLSSLPVQAATKDNSFEKKISISLHKSPVEEKLTDTSERRLTGFASNFKLDPDLEEDDKSTKKEDAASVASNESEDNKTTVKFHPEVTEIEIEEL